MVAGPAVVEDVGKTKNTLGRRGRGKTLPAFVLVTRTAEGDDAGDALVDGETRGAGRAVGGTGHDDFFPEQVVAGGVDELFPAAGRVSFRKVPDELERAFLHAVGLGDRAERGKIFAGGGLEAQLAEGRAVVTGGGGDQAEPFVGVVHLDRVQAVVAETVKERGFVIHEPDHELAARGDAGVDDGVLEVLRFAGFVSEDETDFRMFAGARIDLVGAGGEVKTLRRGVGCEGEAGGREKENRESEHGGKLYQRP